MKNKVYIIVAILCVLFFTSLINADIFVVEPRDDMYTDVEHTTTPPQSDQLWVAEFQPAGHFERIMLRFDFSEFTGETIESVTLNLNRFMGCPQGGTTSVNIYAITEYWDEETWDSHTHVEYDSYVWANYGFSTNGWHSIDIIQLVQAWINGNIENYGLLIRAQSGSKFSKFYSKEYSNPNLHPYLEINYNTGSSYDNLIQDQVFNINNYPNPFNPNTTIYFQINDNFRENAKIEIYDLKGRKIRTFLIPQTKIIDNNSIIWDGRDENNNFVSSGVYLYNLIISDKIVAFNKMILIK